jgi:peptide/nickel transport system permease protein
MTLTEPISREQSRSERKQARSETWRLLRRKPGFVIGWIVMLFWVACAALGKRITPSDPFDDFSQGHLSPRVGHLFGTDRLGRDVLSRVMMGARDVLIMAPIAAILGVIAGTFVGMVMAYYRGVVDDILSRFVDALLSLPVILIALLAIVMLGTSRIVVVTVVAVLFTPIVARTVRAAVMTERQLDYVTSAKLRGEGGLFIMFREILPNISGPIIVELTVRIGYAIFTVATLSFLGVGIQPPSADWGLAISQEYNNMNSGKWWPTLFPSLAIASVVIAVNLIADSLQEVMGE